MLGLLSVSIVHIDFLSNIFAKNYQNQLMYVKVVACRISVIFETVLYDLFSNYNLLFVVISHNFNDNKSNFLILYCLKKGRL